MSDRFFVAMPLSQGDVCLSGPEAHHLAHVRRFQVADVVVLLNGDGAEYPARITALGKRQVDLTIIGVEKPQRETGFLIHVGSALPKADRTDFLIEKLTELGVTDFTPLATLRSIVNPKQNKLEKLRRAVIEASKQCGRNVLMRVHEPCRIEEWCTRTTLPLRRWIAHPDGKRTALVNDLKKDVAIAIGPEGGFSDEELSLACHAGFESIQLGPRIMRVETAALAVAACLSLSNPDGPAPGDLP